MPYLRCGQKPERTGRPRLEQEIGLLLQLAGQLEIASGWPGRRPELAI